MTSCVQSLPGYRFAWPDRKHWPSTLVLLTTLLLYLFAGLTVASSEANEGGTRARGAAPQGAALAMPLPSEAPPIPEPLAFRDMTPAQAAEYNASIPVSSESNPAARPFRFAADSDGDRVRALDCLTAAVYYEAAIEPLEGQRAVAQVVLNRVRHPAFPKSVCGVVFQGSERSTGCQFTFTCDGSLARVPSESGWARARKVAEEALAGKVYKPVGYATHYHTNWVVPYWSGSLTKLANVGAHIFYRWEGGWGRPPAFRYSASGTEPQVAPLRRLTSDPTAYAEGEPAIDPVAVTGDETLVTSGDLTADITGRAVVRRYEPLREEAAATAKAELSKADVPQSLRWALTGESSAAPALGTKTVPAAPAATAAQPKAAATTVGSPTPAK